LVPSQAGHSTPPAVLLSQRTQLCRVKR